MSVIIIVCAYFTITFEIFIFVQQHMKFYCLLKRIFISEAMRQRRRRGKGSRVQEYFQRRRVQRRRQAARPKSVKGVYMNVDGLTESKIQDIQRIILREDSKSISLSIKIG